MKNMLIKSAACALALTGLMVVNGQAQVIFTENFESFDGSGFATSPTTGQLDSDVWSVRGASDGDVAFGGSGTSGDFARGFNDGGTSSGGWYAWDTAGDASNSALGWQGAGSDVTPGSVWLKLTNTTGNTIALLDVSFDRWVNNDQARSNSLDFGYATTDGGSITSVDAFDSTEASDANGFTSFGSGTLNITGLNWANNSDLFLVWSTDDVSGAGSRDELGIDNVSVTVVPEPTSAALITLGLGALYFIRRRR